MTTNHLPLEESLLLILKKHTKERKAFNDSSYCSVRLAGLGGHTAPQIKGGEKNDPRVTLKFPKE